jgi:hypothetical protein
MNFWLDLVLLMSARLNLDGISTEKLCPDVDTPNSARGTLGWNHEAAMVAGSATGQGAQTAWGESAFKHHI